MNEVKIQLQLLTEVLDKKELFLRELLSYTKQQEDLLLEEEFNLTAFNNIMQNKQVRIDKVIEIDEGFQATYNRVGAVLVQQPALYKEEILAMKTKIKSITDLSIEIQVTEEKNKAAFGAQVGGMKNQVKNFRNHKQVNTQYQSNMQNQKVGDTSHFFDSKK
jgi:hypothetical protein